MTHVRINAEADEGVGMFDILRSEDPFLICTSVSLSSKRALACCCIELSRTLRSHLQRSPLDLQQTDATWGNACFVGRVLLRVLPNFVLRVAGETHLPNLELSQYRELERLKLGSMSAPAALFFGVAIADCNCYLRLSDGVQIRNLRPLRERPDVTLADNLTVVDIVALLGSLALNPHWQLRPPAMPSQIKADEQMKFVWRCAFGELDTTGSLTKLLEHGNGLRTLVTVNGVTRVCDAASKLEDSSECERKAALETMSKLEPAVLARHTSVLIAKLEDSSECVRKAALETMSKLKPAVLALHASAFIAKLEDSSECVRKTALETMSKLEPAMLALHTSVLIAKLEDHGKDVPRVLLEMVIDRCPTISCPTKSCPECQYAVHWRERKARWRGETCVVNCMVCDAEMTVPSTDQLLEQTISRLKLLGSS